jgi:hypothetical protein
VCHDYVPTAQEEHWLKAPLVYTAHAHLFVCSLSICSADKYSCVSCKALSSGASPAMALALRLMFYVLGAAGMLIVGDLPKRFWCVHLAVCLACSATAGITDCCRRVLTR